MSRKPFSRLQEPPAEIISQFSTPQWAAELFSDPILIPITNESRVQKSSGADSFCAITLNTPTTIPYSQTFIKNPSPLQTPPDSSSSSSNNHPSSSSSSPSQFPQILTIHKLSTSVNGHIATCHGGFVSVLLDEIIGMAADMEKPEGTATMTAYLHVEYKKPVPTPSTVLCRAWLERREGKEGRKLYGRGTVEDGLGGVLATGEALFVIVQRNMGRL